MHFICACIFFSPWQETYLPNYVSLRLLLKFVCVPQTYTTASREKAALSDRVFENTQMYLCVQIQLCLYSHTHKTSNSLWSETQQHIVGQESCCKTSLKCRELWLKSIIFFNDFFFFLAVPKRHTGSQFPDQGLNPCLLCGVPTTGLPGKSQTMNPLEKHLVSSHMCCFFNSLTIPFTFYQHELGRIDAWKSSSFQWSYTPPPQNS